jgi:hypothetical protein
LRRRGDLASRVHFPNPETGATLSGLSLQGHYRLTWDNSIHDWGCGRSGGFA